MIVPKISKEEVNAFPVVVFDGQITVVDDVAKVHDALAVLSMEKLVGIDTETKPSFSRGQYHKVALLQISTNNHCYLFRLNKLHFPPELAAFLSNPDIRKIGLALRDDFAGLNKLHRFVPANIVDLQSVVKDYGVLELGLQKIFAILFRQKISKSQRLTNWESPELTVQQQRYAATDAWAVLRIYQQLQQEKKLTRKQLMALMGEVAIAGQTNSNIQQP
jgi:ribonuclease D